MTIDIEAVRADTPACRDLIHFNNAGAALQPTCVVESVIEHLRLEAKIGGYEAQDAAGQARARTYAASARLLNCAPEEVAMTTGASEAWWRAFQSVPLGPGDRVLASRAEYNSNAFALIQAARTGIVVDIVPDGADGQIDLDALASMLDDRVKLVTLTHAPTSGGLVNPAEEVGAIVKQHGALYLLDACQTAGQRVLDVDEIQCDFLAFTGRKFVRGPRGTGALYVRATSMAGLDDPTFIDSHSAEWVSETDYSLYPGATRYELFESTIAAQIGLGTAIEYALALGIAEIQTRTTALAVRLREMLEGIDRAHIHDQGRERSGIVVFGIDGADAGDVVVGLRRNTINTSVASSVTSQLDLGARGIDAGIRASVHYYNTESEQDRFIEVLSGLL
jgi:cysteine desulfurase/selenocysteine lyase